jgi:hypothetical protein
MGTAIRIEYGAYGFATSFECKNITQTTTPVTIKFLYDLAFNKTVGVNLTRAYVEFGLLQQLASYYGLWDGSSCGQAYQDKIWFVNISSLEIDIPNPKLGAFTCMVPLLIPSCFLSLFSHTLPHRYLF